MATYTPMIMQYLSVKADHEDAFLFFRLGDFYEMFFEDAINAARELEITLTSRDAGAKERIPMCGVPYHAAATYIEQLVSKGYKVAICEQTEDPKQAKGVVKREVVQVITPGTVIESKSLTDKENNYIASITDFGSNFGFVYCDLSTGQIRTTIFTNGIEDCFNEIALLEIKEMVVAKDFNPSYLQQLKTRFSFTLSFEDQVELTNHSNLIDTISKPQLKTTVSRLINYLLKTQKRSLDHLQPANEYETNHYLKIDYFSKKNLELTETIRFKGRKGSLLWLLDETMTAMGARNMKNWIDRPLLSMEQIVKRQSIVEILVKNYFARMEIRELLKEIYDLERLAGRIAFGNVNAKDLIQMKRSLAQVPLVKQVLLQMNEEQMTQLAHSLDTCEEVRTIIEKAITENPPLSIKEGEIIKDGYNEQLDNYRYAMKNGKDWIVQLEAKEREKTGIKSLKIGYNRVFGYFIEVTKANLHLLKDGQYDRKQTLSNAERFITPELKEKETLILEAQEKSVELEYDLFIEVRQLIKQHIPRLQKLASQISELDCYVSMAHISEERNYVKPNFSMDRTLEIVEGRHPVVEKVLERQGYVPNDCKMSSTREQLLITGPNMSGKSTYMRQIALSVIMAQIGCFVPATKATLPIFDSIFTRIGAADDLIAGQSTFMVEMLEAKNAIVHATKDSLILFDEIGRGTSTYDGMALAQSMIEYIHNKIGAKTLFSTHYHELTDLSESLERLVNVHVSAMEQNKKLIFLHKIKEGPADQSYGIHVAQLAELPEEVIKRATEILEQLEANEPNEIKQSIITEETIVVEKVEESNQLSLFDSLEEHPAISKLKELNIYEMTPMDAMNAIYEIKKLVK